MNIHEIAAQIYSSSISLKQYSSRDLLFIKNRRSLYAKLSDIRSSGLHLQTLCVSEESYTKEHIQLCSYMSFILSECMISLCRKEKKYRAKVISRIWGFHNLPRVFLAANSQMAISIAAAYSYFEHYEKRAQ